LSIVARVIARPTPSRQENPKNRQNRDCRFCGNPHIRREAWRGVARGVGAELVDGVVTCCDGAQHKSRVEARPSGTPGSLRAEIHDRAFEATKPRAVVIDMAYRTVEQWRWTPALSAPRQV